MIARHKRILGQTPVVLGVPLIDPPVRKHSIVFEYHVQFILRAGNMMPQREMTQRTSNHRRARVERVVVGKDQVQLLCPGTQILPIVSFVHVHFGGVEAGAGKEVSQPVGASAQVDDVDAVNTSKGIVCALVVQICRVAWDLE